MNELKYCHQRDMRYLSFIQSYLSTRKSIPSRDDSSLEGEDEDEGNLHKCLCSRNLRCDKALSEHGLLRYS